MRVEDGADLRQRLFWQDIGHEERLDGVLALPTAADDRALGGIQHRGGQGRERHSRVGALRAQRCGAGQQNGHVRDGSQIAAQGIAHPHAHGQLLRPFHEGAAGDTDEGRVKLARHIGHVQAEQARLHFIDFKAYLRRAAIGPGPDRGDKLVGGHYRAELIAQTAQLSGVLALDAKLHRRGHGWPCTIPRTTICACG